MLPLTITLYVSYEYEVSYVYIIRGGGGGACAIYSAIYSAIYGAALRIAPKKDQYPQFVPLLLRLRRQPACASSLALACA